MTKPLRITFVLPVADMTGGCRVVSIYADRLQRRGHSVSIVSVRMPRTGLRETLRYLVKGRGDPFWRRYRSHFDLLSLPHRQLPAGPVTDRDVPEGDVVVATWWETAEWVNTLAPSRGAKVYFMQDYEIWGGPPDRVEAVCGLPMPKIIIAGWMRDLLRERFHQEPLALVPNSVDTKHFSAPPRGKQAVPTVGLTYATNLVKGVDISLKAFALAKRVIPELHLVAMGNDQVAPDLPLPPGAEFTHQARDGMLRTIYSRCDAWLFGTRREGFGLPILEAMACRTPVIGTPAGAAPDLLPKGGGIMIPPENPEAMAQAIVDLCRLPAAEWRILSDKALATASSFTWDDATDQFEAALSRVAPDTSPPARQQGACG